MFSFNPNTSWAKFRLTEYGYKIYEENIAEKQKYIPKACLEKWPFLGKRVKEDESGYMCMPFSMMASIFGKDISKYSKEGAFDGDIMIFQNDLEYLEDLKKTDA